MQKLHMPWSKLLSTCDVFRVLHFSTVFATCCLSLLSSLSFIILLVFCDASYWLSHNNFTVAECSLWLIESACSCGHFVSNLRCSCG